MKKKKIQGKDVASLALQKKNLRKKKKRKNSEQSKKGSPGSSQSPGTLALTPSQCWTQRGRQRRTPGAARGRPTPAHCTARGCPRRRRKGRGQRGRGSGSSRKGAAAAAPWSGPATTPQRSCPQHAAPRPGRTAPACGEPPRPIAHYAAAFDAGGQRPRRCRAAGGEGRAAATAAARGGRRREGAARRHRANAPLRRPCPPAVALL